MPMDCQNCNEDRGAPAKQFIMRLGIFPIPQLCILSIVLTYKAINRRKMEAVEEEVARNQPERVITGQVFREPRLSTFLSALIGSTIFSLEMMESLSVNPSSRSLGWPIYAKAALVHLVFGFFAGYMTVKMMKSMKASQVPWILVCLQVPFISNGLFLLYCIAVGIVVRDIGISTILWVCFSTPAILLGGYAATSSTYSRLPIHLVATDPDPPVVVTDSATCCCSVQFMGVCAAYLVSFYGFLGISHLLARTWNDSVSDCVNLLIPITFLLVASVYIFLGFSHAVVIRFNQSACWWKLYFMIGVPAGISLLPFSLQRPIATSLASFVVVMLKAGTLGPLLLYFFYPLLFRKQQPQTQQQQILNRV